MSGNKNSLQVKSFDSPDEHRAPEKTSLGVNHLGEHTIGRLQMEPGWVWSECIKPVVLTDSCQLNHVGYCVSGTLEIELDDGQSATITAGDSYTIPPGHDARVVGEEAFVGIEFASAAQYGVPVSS
ncbi:cupin domain-containing protein [Cryobacterium psychrophilum]|uniref:Cupin domain-containing protein n=1 Tax=Cryobacterium psychrophilum TaxID=41988 RepID=A0A4Y8KS15_9MICO|nr:cupin domain-containing protein [Cryobacterium psychrophilum]TDW28718.1 hypothetical protein EDD25_0350 [Cryobacterium psychrophilum]TFD82378.1 cupin domain-containing protein [Cryobacterium psychrophilum]